MNIKLTFLLLLSVITIMSCEDQPVGKWDDNIKLSNDELTFSAGAGSETITTEGDLWWLISIRTDVDDYENFEGTDTTDDSFEISRDDITFERIEKTTIKIDLAENNTGAERTFVIGLQAGNYFDSIVITQEAD